MELAIEFKVMYKKHIQKRAVIATARFCMCFL